MRFRRLISLQTRRAGLNNLRNGLLSKDKYFCTGLPNIQYTMLDTLQNTLVAHRHVDPYKIVEDHIVDINDVIKDMTGSDLPFLSNLIEYVFEVKGKHIRPVIVLLIAKAMTGEINESQKSLSQITEMLHTASLLHDDVLDHAHIRRGKESVNSRFGNKVAILGGDFLLARASVALARLRNTDAVELLATVIEHLVKGEILQTQNSADHLSRIDLYIVKSFYKTASLIANSCKAAAILCDANEDYVKASFEYGKHLGILFQVVDDILDFESTSGAMGKPCMNDIKNGIASAPIIYASEEHPELTEAIDRKFSNHGDVDTTLDLLSHSSGMQKAKELAEYHASQAVAAALQFPDSQARSGLINLVEVALNRRK